eukprot:6194361-Pleurochrysis_carterae.AAC.4
MEGEATREARGAGAAAAVWPSLAGSRAEAKTSEGSHRVAAPENGKQSSHSLGRDAHLGKGVITLCKAVGIAICGPADWLSRRSRAPASGRRRACPRRAGASCRPSPLPIPQEAARSRAARPPAEQRSPATSRSSHLHCGGASGVFDFALAWAVGSCFISRRAAASTERAGDETLRSQRKAAALSPPRASNLSPLSPSAAQWTGDAREGMGLEAAEQPASPSALGEASPPRGSHGGGMRSAASAAALRVGEACVCEGESCMGDNVRP